MLATKAKRIKSPVTRYPGSKRLHLPMLLKNAPDVECIIEPFGGAAHYSIARLQSSSLTRLQSSSLISAYVGEIDPTIRALFEVWRKPTLHPLFLAAVNTWANYLADVPALAWKDLCQKVEKCFQFSGTKAYDFVHDYSYHEWIVESAAAGAVLRKLTFGGVVRCNAEGKQNAPFVQGQLDKLWMWKPSFDGAEFAQRILMRNDYKDVIKTFKHSSFTSAEAFIDPPYYAPRQECPRQQTPAYWNHKPHEAGTRDLCLNAVEECAKDKRIKRILVTNYVSQCLDGRLRFMSKQHNRSISFVEGKTLKTMQRSTGKIKDGIKEGFWEII